MITRFHKNFEKKFKKLSLSQRQKTETRLQLFLLNPYNPQLNNHPLKGEYLDYRSINISGDLRAVFKLINEEEAIFVTIDNHSNLYG